MPIIGKYNEIESQRKALVKSAAEQRTVAELAIRQKRNHTKADTIVFGITTPRYNDKINKAKHCEPDHGKDWLYKIRERNIKAEKIRDKNKEKSLVTNNAIEKIKEYRRVLEEKIRQEKEEQKIKLEHSQSQSDLLAGIILSGLHFSERSVSFSERIELVETDRHIIN